MIKNNWCENILTDIILIIADVFRVIFSPLLAFSKNPIDFGANRNAERYYSSIYIRDNHSRILQFVYIIMGVENFCLVASLIFSFLVWYTDKSTPLISTISNSFIHFNLLLALITLIMLCLFAIIIFIVILVKRGNHITKSFKNSRILKICRAKHYRFQESINHRL